MSAMTSANPGGAPGTCWRPMVIPSCHCCARSGCSFNMLRSIPANTFVPIGAKFSKSSFPVPCGKPNPTALATGSAACWTTRSLERKNPGQTKAVKAKTPSRSATPPPMRLNSRTGLPCCFLRCVSACGRGGPRHRGLLLHHVGHRPAARAFPGRGRAGGGPEGLEGRSPLPLGGWGFRLTLGFATGRTATEAGRAPSPGTVNMVVHLGHLTFFPAGISAFGLRTAWHEGQAKDAGMRRCPVESG